MKKKLTESITVELGYGAPEHEFILPEVTDISGQEGIRLELELLEDGTAELEVTLYPLKIARPEFFPSVKGRVAVAGKGLHSVDIPFEQFHFRQMVRAFLNYLDGVSVRLLQGVPVLLRGIEADAMGDFIIQAEETSKTGDAGEWVEYPLLLSNRSGAAMLVNIHQSLYGKECLAVEYSPYVALDAHSEKEYVVKVKVTEDIPAGGLERSSFLFVPNGDRGKAGKIRLQTSRKREHPYLFLKESQWEKRKRAILSDEKLYGAFRKEYVETAENWEVPEPSDREEYVYPSYTQNGLFKTAVAWKITGEETYLRKVMKYFDGFLNEKKGYLATRKSYFEFVESREEYVRGDFKVCHAQSGGWVQEAEFFNKLAMTYDLLYEYFSPQERRDMEACLKNYIKFESWRLTDGDGNNFQIAESGAGMLCAMAIQNQDMVERFLYGYNGFTDLLSAVFLDDGMYFEEASGYVRLAGELFFDIANAAENYGISLKEIRVPASFDRDILHSPWAMRESWAEDGKPFLGMSFRRFDAFTGTTKSLKDYFDCTARLLTDRGIMFSVNDSNEQDFTELYKRAYYLYEEPLYKEIAELSPEPETLLVPEKEAYELGRGSLLLSGAGMGILRAGNSQAVLKFGGHGGYHGHYDRLSLASFLKDNRTFHNNEYAWFGYDSFLFKMWVQTSVAHNMTVVDVRMQKPSPCRCVYFETDKKTGRQQGTEGGTEKGDRDVFSAVCAQTTTVWMDPPYGGQTPYPYAFPEEKCAREGRFILEPPKARAQGDIGEYSEPVFQRRMLILFHGYCVVWDYLEGQEEHRFDCLYHPMGRFDKCGFEEQERIVFAEKERFSEDPFGAGQFIQNCYTAQVDGTVCLRFQEGQPRVNGNDIVDHMPEAVLWRAWPETGTVTVGKYPQKGDSFTAQNREACAGYLEEPLKKTVSFTVQGTKAEFITILEAGEPGKIRSVSSREYGSVMVTENTGKTWKISVTGMERKEASVSVSIDRISS